MQANIETSDSGAKCYHCQGMEPVMVCHHCGRPICAECGPAPLPEGWFFERVANVEFVGLEVDDLTPDGQGVHCRFHAHAARSLNDQLLVGIGIFLALVTVVLALAAATVNGWFVVHMLVVSATSALSFYAAYLEGQSWRAEVQRHRPPMPIVGQNLLIRVQEKVGGRIHLDGTGRYRAFAEAPKGQLDLDLQFASEDSRRWRLYQNRYPLIDTEGDAFHAGFIYLEGAERLQFDGGQPIYQNHLALGEQIANHAFFADGGDREWMPTYAYSFALQKEEGNAGLPVQIVPTLISEGGKLWGIQLIVQLNPRANAPGLSNPRVQRLDLTVPSLLGEPESKNPYAYPVSAPGPGSSPGDEQTLRWEAIPLEEENGRGPEVTFYARFGQSHLEDPTQTIHGELHVLFDGALSGLRNVWRYSPLGYRIEDRPLILRRQTEVTITFEFDLRALTLRRSVGCTESTEKLPGVPNSHTIRELVKRFSKNNIYVQRVIENLPQMSRANAKVLNRFWVIGGRRYVDVYPIDFRVVVTGTARYGDKDAPEDGSTKCDVMTQGTVVDGQMEQEIERLRQELLETIRTVLC